MPNAAPSEVNPPSYASLYEMLTAHTSGLGKLEGMFFGKVTTGDPAVELIIKAGIVIGFLVMITGIGGAKLSRSLFELFLIVIFSGLFLAGGILGIYWLVDFFSQLKKKSIKRDRLVSVILIYPDHINILHIERAGNYFTTNGSWAINYSDMEISIIENMGILSDRITIKLANNYINIEDVHLGQIGNSFNIGLAFYDFLESSQKLDSKYLDFHDAMDFLKAKASMRRF